MNLAKIENDRVVTARNRLRNFGYRGDEMLMEINGGHVGTARSWAEESFDWQECDGECCFGTHNICECPSIHEQFASLIQVEKDSDGDWMEVT